MSRVEVSGAWEGEVAGAVEKFFEDRLGPDIARDAKRYCPERSGSLMESIEHHIEDGDLIVSATGGAGGRVYAAFVELGHRVFHPSTGITGPEVVPPQPFCDRRYSSNVANSANHKGNSGKIMETPRRCYQHPGAGRTWMRGPTWTSVHATRRDSGRRSARMARYRSTAPN